MSDEQGMATGTVIAKLRSGATDAEAGEALTFSQRYAMREAADRLSALEAENTRMRAVVERVANASWAIYPSGEHLYNMGDAMELNRIARAILANASDGGNGTTNEPPA